LEYGKAPLPISSAIQSESDDVFVVKMLQTLLHFSMENRYPKESRWQFSLYFGLLTGMLAAIAISN
jgi:hypothetical protein